MSTKPWVVVFQHFDITARTILGVRGRAVVRVTGRSWSSVPGFVKILLVVQAVVIIGLSGWIYNEYVNNQYLQLYLFSLFEGKGSLFAIIGLGGLVGTALIGILLKAGNILGEIEHLSEKVETGTDVKTMNRPKPTATLVLKIATPKPRDEIGRLHGSLQRWKERFNSGE